MLRLGPVARPAAARPHDGDGTAAGVPLEIGRANDVPARLAQRRVSRPSSRWSRTPSKATSSSSSRKTARPISCSRCSDLTWNAYNKWPGHDSLYDDGLPHPNNGHYYTGPNVRTSFDRPYAQYGQVHEVALSLGSGEYLLWEFPLAFWMEQQGYGVTYCSNLDVDRDPAVLDRCQGLPFGGPRRILDPPHVRPRDGGPRARRQPGISQRQHHAAAKWSCTTAASPTSPAAPWPACAGFRDEQSAHGRAQLSGSGYGDWIVTQGGPLDLRGHRHAQRGLHPRISGLGIPRRARRLAGDGSGRGRSDWRPSAATRREDGKFAAVVFPCKKGNWVFNAGTIWWNEGLANPPGHAPAASRLGRTFGVDARVQRITANFFNRCLRDSPLK